MSTTTVDIRATPMPLAELLALAAEGTEVIIAEGDETLARLVPMTNGDKGIGNLNPGSISTSDDFDAPLNELTLTQLLEGVTKENLHREVK